MTQDKPMPNIAFRGMSFALRLMEPFKRSRERLTGAGLEKGQVVLEYGCGIGSYTIPAAQIVGDKGTVYALDIHPLSIKTVKNRSAKENLTNIKTILSDRDTGLPDECVDVVLLYDTFHLVRDQQALLEELHRVLKPAGFLSADHMHTAREDFLETMQAENRFSYQSQGRETFPLRVFTFIKCII
jgi:ubiquinone/menaquinone biosynthesis C-methylase UbiE